MVRERKDGHKFQYVRSEVKYDVYECINCGKVVKDLDLEKYTHEQCSAKKSVGA
jgi:hypothetical protein